MPREVMEEVTIAMEVMVAIMVEAMEVELFGSDQDGGIRGGVHLIILIITLSHPMSFNNKPPYMNNRHR
jgi:hypothetical protein